MKKRVIWGASIAVAALCLCFGSMEGCHPYIDPSENGIDERICTDEGGAVRETAGETEDKISGEIPDKTAGEDVDDTTGGADGETVDIDFTIRESPVDTARYDAQTDRVYKEAFLKAITGQAPIRYRYREGTVTYRELLPDGEGMGEEAFLKAVRQSEFFYQDYDGDGLPELIIDTEGPCVLKYHPKEDQVELYQQKEQGWYLLGAGQMYMDGFVCTEEYIGSVQGYESIAGELSACYLLSPIGEEGTVCRVTIDGQRYTVADEGTTSRLQQDFYRIKDDAPHPMSFAVLFGGGGGQGYLPGGDQPPRYLLEDMGAIPMNEAGGEEWEAYKAMLEGDFSLVEDGRWTSLQRDYARDIESHNGSCSWSYLLMDVDRDGVRELVLRLDPDVDGSDSMAYLHYADGHIKMWGRSYGAGLHYWYEVPLVNGKVLSVYRYQEKDEEQMWISRLDPQCQMMTERGYCTGTVTDGQDDGGQDRSDGQTEGRAYHQYWDYHHDGAFCGGPIDLSVEGWQQVEAMLGELSIPEGAWQPCSVFTPREERPEVPQEAAGEDGPSDDVGEDDSVSQSSYGDPFATDVPFAGQEALDLVRDLYEEAGFAGTYQAGDRSLYDYYREKFALLLKGEVTVYDPEGEESILNGLYSMDDYRYTGNAAFYFFDMDGDGAPELCIAGNRGTFICRYDVRTDSYHTWWEHTSSGHTILGTRKIMWDHSGDDEHFMQLDADGEIGSGVTFMNVYWPERRYLVSIPGFEERERDGQISAEVERQVLYDPYRGMYCLRVTEGQYDELIEGLHDARRAAWEERVPLSYFLQE